MSESKLSPNQQKFLAYIIEQMHQGRNGKHVYEEALKAAGYGETVTVYHVLQSAALKDAIYTAYKEQVALYGVEAMGNLINLMRNPETKHWRAQLNSAQAVLDASAIPYKMQEQQASTPHGVVVMPAKKKVVITVEETDEENGSEGEF